jgi:hypothetical protein
VPCKVQGAPGHDELAHGARVLSLFPVPHRLVVGHRNLVATKPKQRRTLVAVPRHGDSAHNGEVHQTHKEYGASNLLTAAH